MSKKPAKPTTQWQLACIQTLAFQVDSHLLRNVDLESLRFDFKRVVSLIGDGTIIRVEIFVAAADKNTTDTNILALHIRVDYMLDVEETARIKRKIEPPIVKAVMQCSHNILQGIWFTKVEGTVLEEFVLPMMHGEPAL